MDTLYPEICKKYLLEAQARHISDKREKQCYGKGFDEFINRIVRDEVAHFIAHENVVDIETMEGREDIFTTGTVYIMNPKHLRRFVTEIIIESRKSNLCNLGANHD